MRNLSIYYTLLKLQIKTQTEYRGAFIVLFIAKIFSWGTGFLMIGILLYKFGNILGWNAYEVLFIYALDVLSYSLIAQFLVRPCSWLTKYIRSGEFDVVLTKPMNTFLYYIFRNFSTGYFSNLIFCTAVIIFALNKLRIPYTFFNICFLLITLIGGSLIQGACFLLSAIPSFWMVKNDSLSKLLQGDLKSFIRYPISIYHKPVQFFLTFIIPYAFINFYPAQYFLRKNDGILFHPVFPFLTPLIGLLLFAGAYWFWLFGINHYESAGS